MLGARQATYATFSWYNFATARRSRRSGGALNPDLSLSRPSLLPDESQEVHSLSCTFAADMTLPCLAPHEFLSSLGRRSLGIGPLSYPFSSSIQLWCRTGLAWSSMDDTLPRRRLELYSPCLAQFCCQAALEIVHMCLGKKMGWNGDAK